MTYVSPYVLAKRIGVKPHSIYRWIREGKILPEETKKIEIKKERLTVDAALTLEKIKSRMMK